MNRASNKIYLDYAASTPVDPRVLRAMQPYFGAKFGNPGSLHSFGQEAIAAVDTSRETIAKAIGADFREVIFTGSATEANNLALRGVVRRAMSYELRAKQNPKPLIPRVIISSIEHESVLETARDLERDGVEVVHIPVDHAGIVDLKKLKESLTENTVLVSVMYANNEIGTVQPIAEISQIVRNFRETKRGECPLFFHTDAAQALQFFDCDVRKLGVDLMTFSAHKIYGPKGTGALYTRDMRQGRGNKGKNKFISHIPYPISPILTGGGQEFGLRSGTENVPTIVGFAKAIELISNSIELENKKICGLRDYFWLGIKKIHPKAELNSQFSAPSAQCLPNILNVYFPGHAAQDLLTRFDLAGLAASSGSACQSRAMESSYVLGAIGYSKERAKLSIRFSLGRPTTKQEIDAALKIARGILMN